MHKLRRLYAADNELAVVPAELGSLLLLSELDLANNNLSRIPSQVGAMSLRVIRVDGNPLLWPAMALVEEGQVRTHTPSPRQPFRPFRPIRRQSNSSDADGCSP